MDLEAGKIINNFFRGLEVSHKTIRILQKNYEDEVAAAMSNGGCSRCKKNSIRRRFKKLVLNQLEKLRNATAE
tara:strand:+ start:69 stop:287 length:219 start_codon:yes stop_codon:yes gene_type:complete